LNHVFNDDDILEALIQEKEQSVLREDDLHWLDERISQSEKDKGARDGGDERPSQRGKGIAMNSSTSSGDDEDRGNDSEESNGDDSNNGETTVLREGPIVLVEANEVLCHEIQIIMPHGIMIMEAY